MDTLLRVNVKIPGILSKIYGDFDAIIHLANLKIYALCLNKKKKSINKIYARCQENVTKRGRGVM